MTHLIAIDQGTTSTRAIVFDAGLAPVAVAQQELRQIYPKPGWVEHDQ
jgi:glycerol kinase